MAPGEIHTRSVQTDRYVADGVSREMSPGVANDASSKKSLRLRNMNYDVTVRHTGHACGA